MTVNFFFGMIFLFLFSAGCSNESNSGIPLDSTSFCIEPGGHGTYIVLIGTDTLENISGSCVVFGNDKTAKISTRQAKLIRKAPVFENGTSIMNRVYNFGVGKYDNPTRNIQIDYILFYVAIDSAEAKRLKTDGNYVAQVKKEMYLIQDSTLASWENDRKIK